MLLFNSFILKMRAIFVGVTGENLRHGRRHPLTDELAYNREYLILRRIAEDRHREGASFLASFVKSFERLNIVVRCLEYIRVHHLFGCLKELILFMRGGEEVFSLLLYGCVGGRVPLIIPIKFAIRRLSSISRGTEDLAESVELAFSKQLLVDHDAHVCLSRHFVEHTWVYFVLLDTIPDDPVDHIPREVT